MLYDFYQDSRIGRNRDLAKSAKDTSQKSARDVDQLERKVEHLMMVTEALWSVIKESHEMDDDDLREVIKNIDLRDGNLNGRVAKKPPQKCPRCKKTIQRRQSKCMYCGTEVDKEIFET